MEKMSLIDRMCENLREEGSLQIVELTNMLNDDNNYKNVTRNTVNTLLYTRKDKFKKVGYGRFNILDGNKNTIEENIILKLINYSPKLLSKINFSEKELEIIIKIKGEE